MTLRATSITLVALAGCGTLGPPRERFLSSSLDHNLGRPHAVTLRGASVDRAADRLIALGKQRDLTLVKQTACDAQRCALVFRGSPTDRRVFRNARSVVLSYYSRYFVQLARVAGGVRAEALGVPVLGGEMACPPRVARTARCEPPALESRPGATLVAAVREDWGYDVSGAGEAEVLEGLLAELARAPAAAAASTPAARAESPAIVAVFDVEDPSGALRDSKLVAELTEYLAAQVTQRSGYRVVPRDQLRERLARQKVGSYRQCYDQRCQIEIGKALAAQKSLATKLLRVGRQCAFTAMLYDLRTEATERAATERTSCSDDALLGAIEQLARQLAEPRR